MRDTAAISLSLSLLALPNSCAVDGGREVGVDEALLREDRDREDPETESARESEKRTAGNGSQRTKTKKATGGRIVERCGG